MFVVWYLKLEFINQAIFDRLKKKSSLKKIIPQNSSKKNLNNSRKKLKTKTQGFAKVKNAVCENAS